MTNVIWKTVGAAACACALAINCGAAQKTATNTTKTKTSTTAIRNVWPPETLSGKIILVDPAKNLVVVTGPHGATFDMRVTSSTKIRSGGQTLTLKDLNRDQQKNVSVEFVPERLGDIARSIQITG